MSVDNSKLLAFLSGLMLLPLLFVIARSVNFASGRNRLVAAMIADDSAFSASLRLNIGEELTVESATCYLSRFLL